MKYRMDPVTIPSVRKSFKDIPDGHGFLDPKSGYRYYMLSGHAIDVTGGAGYTTSIMSGQYVDLGPHSLHIVHED